MNWLKLARIGLELAYDIAREALRKRPIVHDKVEGMPLSHLDVERQRKASQMAGHEPPLKRSMWN
jgi:hypothetical protein